jgi:hypothetical protein
MKMNEIINKLERLSEKSEQRAQKNIANLIGRIKYFENDDKDKLNNCLAEAELWLNG